MFSDPFEILFVFPSVHTHELSRDGMKKGLWGWGTFVEMAIFGVGHTEWTKVTGLGLTQLCGRFRRSPPPTGVEN